MTHRVLTGLGKRRDGDFYLAALRYAQVLWLRGFTARALLAASRGLYCPLRSDEPESIAHPWPYAAIGWMIAAHSGDTFMGNPRVSFQHQATRARGVGQRRFSARAWAVWHVVRAVAPELPGDATQRVVPPAVADVRQRLERWGSPREAEVWLKALQSFSR